MYSPTEESESVRVITQLPQLCGILTTGLVLSYLLQSTEVWAAQLGGGEWLAEQQPGFRTKGTTEKQILLRDSIRAPFLKSRESFGHACSWSSLVPKHNQFKEIFSKIPQNKTVRNQRQRVLKAARQKKLVIFKGTPIRLSVDFSGETLQARRKCDDIFKTANNEFSIQWNCPSKGKIKTFPNKAEWAHYY